MRNDELPSVESTLSTTMDSYEVGDLVWAKVKSHPWWPGRIFDVADASHEARTLEKPGRILVAFYGDHKFAWLDHPQILGFRPNFDEKAIVTSTRSFRDAMSEALHEISLRARVGLQCQCRRKSELDDELAFYDVGYGDCEGLLSHKDVLTSKETFNTRMTLCFLRGLASSPCSPSSPNMDVSILHGHLLGIRRGVFADASKNETLEEGMFVSSGEGGGFVYPNGFGIGTTEILSEVNRRKRGNGGYDNTLEECERAKRPHCAGFEGGNEDRERASSDRERDKESHVFMEISEALQSVAIDPLCQYTAYSLTVAKMEVFVRFRDLFFQKSAGYGHHWQTPSSRKKTQMKDAPTLYVGTGDRDHDSPSLVAKAVRYTRPTSQKKRTVDPPLDRIKTHPHVQAAELTGVCEGDEKLSYCKVESEPSLGFDTHTSGAPSTELPQKHDVRELLMDTCKSRSNFTHKALSKLDVHELLFAARKFQCTKEVPTKGTAIGGDIFSEVHCDVRRDASVATGPPKGSVGLSSKNFAVEESMFSEAADADGTDHLSRANRGDVLTEHFFEEMPGIGALLMQNCATTKACTVGDLHIASCMSREEEKSSHMCDSRASSSRTLHDKESLSTEEHGDGASSLWPVGLFMKFPSSFTLPSETQLNAIFVEFGALETVETRVFRDTASAQVIFKHRNKAEAAYRHVKETSPFGKASVAFRLQHFAHRLSILDKRASSS